MVISQGIIHHAAFFALFDQAEGAQYPKVLGDG